MWRPKERAKAQITAETKVILQYKDPIEKQPAYRRAQKDVADILYEKGSIGKDELNAARQFSNDFETAKYGASQSSCILSLDRVDGTGGANVFLLTEAQERARRQVARCLNLVGDIGGQALWWCCGYGLGATDWAAKRKIHKNAAAPILRSALEAIAGPGGYGTRQTRNTIRTWKDAEETMLQGMSLEARDAYTAGGAS